MNTSCRLDCVVSVSMCCISFYSLRCVIFAFSVSVTSISRGSNVVFSGELRGLLIKVTALRTLFRTCSKQFCICCQRDAQVRTLAYSRICSLVKICIIRPIVVHVRILPCSPLCVNFQFYVGTQITKIVRACRT